MILSAQSAEEANVDALVVYFNANGSVREFKEESKDKSAFMLALTNPLFPSVPSTRLNSLNVEYELTCEDLKRGQLRAEDLWRKGFTAAALRRSGFDENDVGIVVLGVSRADWRSQQGPTVRIPNLKDKRLGDEGAKALGPALASGSFPALTQFSLENNFICEEGAKALGSALASGSYPALTQLSLASNFIGDEGAVAIGATLQSPCTLR